MKSLFIVSTQYHLGCALDIYQNLGDEISCDIAVEGSLLKKNMQLLQRSANHMHGEVILLPDVNKLQNFLFLFCCKLNRCNKNYYKNIFVFSPSLISARYRLENQEANFYLGEDGSGSYSGLILNRFAYFDRSLKHSGVLSNILRLIFKSNLDLKPQGVYLYQPNAVSYDYSIPVYKISRNRTTNEIMHAAYDNKKTTYRAFFLGQYYKEIGVSYEDLKEIYVAGNLIDNKFVYRKHPRDTWNPSDILVDDSGDWEQICETIDDDTILISLGSTAVQSPKYLYDKEPYVIFTYKLHAELYSEFAKSYEAIAASLMKLYRSDKKIFIANDLDDFKLILESLK